jgi:hypothetical protein
MHYSRVTDIPKLASDLEAQVRELVEIARRNADRADAKDAIMKDMQELWRGLARKHGVQLSDERIDALLRDDAELNAQGLIAWLGRQKRAA